jgi:sortase A
VYLVAMGAALLSVWLVPTVYGTAMSHLAVAAFRAQSSSNRMWDSARIRAYKASLNMNIAPPEAVLRVPRLNVEVPVLEGTSDAILNRGVGHIAGTALPGQVGNLAITGHRDGFFRPLKDIRSGDVIEVERADHGHNQVDRYLVRSLSVVVPSDTSVLKPTFNSTLTLITCYPFYYVGSAPQRFVVQADLLPSPQMHAARAAPSVQPFTGE